jgi:hypothetical protein
MKQSSWVLVHDTGVQVTRTRKTVDGFLEVWGVAAVQGVMDYPERGFSAYVDGATLRATAADLRGKPVTREHPDGTLIDASNAAQYALGTVIDAQYDEVNERVLVHLVVYDAELIDEIESKRRAQLSPGYRTKFEDMDKPVEGATKAQTTRVYNHLAVVESARGGDECRIFDAKPPQATGSDMIQPKEAADKPDKPAEDMEAPKPPVQDAYTARMDALEAKIDALMGMIKPKEDGDKPDKPAEDMEAPPKEEEESMDSIVARVRRAQRAADTIGITIPDGQSRILDMERTVAAAVVGDSARHMTADALQGVITAALAGFARSSWSMERATPKTKADDLPPLKQDPWLEAARRRK